MKNLTGSEKQIKWATDIRDEAISNINARIAQANDTVETGRNDEIANETESDMEYRTEEQARIERVRAKFLLQIKQWNNIIEWLSGLEDASKWIQYKNDLTDSLSSYGLVKITPEQYLQSNLGRNQIETIATILRGA